MATKKSVILKNKGLSIRELQAIIENEWSDDDDDETDPNEQLSNALGINIVVLPPDDVDGLTDTEDVPDDLMFCDGAVPADDFGSVPEICGTAEMHVEYPEGDNDDEDVPLSIRYAATRDCGLPRSKQQEKKRWRKRALQALEQPINMSDIAMKNLAEKYSKSLSSFAILFLCFLYSNLHTRRVLAYAIVAAVRG